MSLYKEILLDHYKHPRHHGTVTNPNFTVTEFNPLCGDLIQISGVTCPAKPLATLGYESRNLLEAKFRGKGCVISQATASILLEKYVGKSANEILAITPDDILALIQMELGPNRIKCALLPLIALQNGIKSKESGTC